VTKLGLKTDSCSTFTDYQIQTKTNRIL
jgi:hypothetical protein